MVAMDVSLVAVHIFDGRTFGSRFAFPDVMVDRSLVNISKTAVGKQDITCTPVELVTLTPPSGQTCGNYMEQYIANAGGYLTNPDASSACHFCSYRTTDQFLGTSFNIEYAHHWRNFGIIMAFVLFNVSTMRCSIGFTHTDRCVLSCLAFTCSPTYSVSGPGASLAPLRNVLRGREPEFNMYLSVTY